jgi:exopolysaccharide biosynthesis polyprenyl glycosylphosphotransferase
VVVGKDRRAGVEADMNGRARRERSLTSSIGEAPAPSQRSTGRGLQSVAQPVASVAARPSPRRLRRLLIASDVLAIVVGYVAATVIQQIVKPVPDATLRDEALFAVLVVPIWVLMMGANNLFHARAVSRFEEEFQRLFVSGLMATGFLVAVLFVAQYEELSRLWVGLLFVCVTSSLVVSRLWARRVFNRLRREGRIRRPVIIVGTGCEAVSLFDATRRRPDLGYEVLGFTGDQVGAAGSAVLGSIDETVDVVRRTGATGAILSVASLHPDEVNRLTRILTTDGCHVTLSSSLHDIDIARTRSQSIDGRLMIYVEPTNRSQTHRLLKRTFDVVVAGLALLLTLPIMVFAAVAIKLDSRGPVLFRQVRVGKDGELFEMLKFRSMVQDAEEMRSELEVLNERSGPLFKLSADPRITRTGRWLRKSSVDELPQFWNVLRGEMSVVGPRPALPSETEQWTPDLRERLRVLPGITGMWQVSGRSEADFELYRRLDLFYVDNWSLLHDLKIVAKTFSVVLTGRGSH